MQNNLKSKFIIYNPDLKAFFMGTSGKWAFSHHDAVVYNSIDEANLARLSIHEHYQDYNIGFLIYEFSNEVEHFVRFVHDDLAGSTEPIIPISKNLTTRVKKFRNVKNNDECRNRMDILLSNIKDDG